MKTPEIHRSVFVAPTATVAGNVRIGAHSSVFFGAVIRSELDEIVVGENTNIQDHKYGCCSLDGTSLFLLKKQKT